MYTKRVRSQIIVIIRYLGAGKVRKTLCHLFMTCLLFAPHHLACLLLAANKQRLAPLTAGTLVRKSRQINQQTTTPQVLDDFGVVCSRVYLRDSFLSERS